MLIYMEVMPPDFGSWLSILTQNWNTLLNNAVVAGLVILVLTIIGGRVEAWLMRRRERQGLLWVFDAEVYENRDIP